MSGSILPLVVDNIIVDKKQICSTLHSQVIEYRRVDIDTDAERRTLHRTEDDTRLYIKSSSVNLQTLARLAIGFLFGYKILSIVRVAVVIDIMQSQGDTPPYAVLDASADVEIVDTDVAMLILSEKEGTTIIEILQVILVLAHQLMIILVHTVPDQVTRIADVAIISCVDIVAVVSLIGSQLRL